MTFIRIRVTRKPLPEPPLTCPAIDAFISKHSPSDEIVKELAAIRDINSQLRFGLWSEQARADEAEANLDSRADIVEECARMADGWLAAHGANEIKYTSARDYACDAVADIADAIRGLADPRLDHESAASAAAAIFDYADNNLSMFEACSEEDPVKARELYEAAKRLREIFTPTTVTATPRGTEA